MWSDDVWIVNPTPVECGRSRETVKRSDLVGWAEDWLGNALARRTLRR